jgi:hypothetical protein
MINQAAGRSSMIIDHSTINQSTSRGEKHAGDKQQMRCSGAQLAAEVTA